MTNFLQNIFYGFSIIGMGFLVWKSIANAESKQPVTGFDMDFPTFQRMLRTLTDALQ